MLKTKHSHLFIVTNQSYGRVLSRMVFLYFSKKRYFSCSPLSIALCNRVNIHKYNANWYINFELINGCGTHKNNIGGYFFF